MLECHPTPTVRNQSAATRQGPPGELCSCVLTGGGEGLAQSSSAEPSPRRLSAWRWGGAGPMEEERGPSLTPEQALSLAGAGDRFQGGPVSGTAGWCRLLAGT